MYEKSNFSTSVMIYLSWDSDSINDSMSYPPIYKVYQEYKKQKNERDLTMMKYQYEFMQTIVEAIKTVSKLLWVFNSFYNVLNLTEELS